MTLFKSFLAALLIGAVSAFAFQPYGLWPLMPLAFVGLAELISRAPSMRCALLIGWAFGVGQFTVGLNWIATAFTFQAAMPAWLGWIAVVLLSLYLAVYPLLATGLAWRFGQRDRFMLMLALSGAWPISEWLRATMFTGFAWNPVGAALADTPFLNWAQFVGTYGLSTLVVFLGGAIWLALHNHKAPRNAVLGFAILFGVMLAIPAPPATHSGKPIRVVQPNIGQQDKWRPGYDEIAADTLDRLTIKGRPVTRMVLWPEAAITDPLEDGRASTKWQTLDQRLRATRALAPGDLLLTGGLSLTSSDGQTVSGATNSVYVLGPLGTTVGRYDKAHLVPYGEYLPMRPVLSAIGLSRLAPGDLDFAAGPGPRTIQLPGTWGKVGFQLCYEIIFSGQVVDRANRPDFIFNPSNDAWFGRWGPPQHLAQARLRAAEEGLPVIRATPTGISAVVDANGEIVKSLPWKTAGVIDADLPRPHKPTLFARMGNVIPLAEGFLLLLIAIALDRRARYRAHI